MIRQSPLCCGSVNGDAKEIAHMRKVVIALCIALFAPSIFAATPAPRAAWKAKVAQTMPLLGHRNWILIVDSAYPLQASQGVETIETNASQIDVVRYVLATIGHSIHVRPDIIMDAELPFIPEEDAHGASAYRKQIGALLRGYAIESQPHEKIIAGIDE